MWPFKKRQAAESQHLSSEAVLYSQLDVTESFGGNLDLKAGDWVATIPLNSMIDNPESSGLPPVNASADEIFGIASRLSSLRESFPDLKDGVYCAVCHIANVDISKLRTPCPKCGRDLLKFGWD